jgi:phenylpropionate dioxygenase-like ring-hydroxylating dioxygenase large terminal subunit
MTLHERLATGRGKYTYDYPEVGAGPVSYDDCVDPRFFDDEREAVFKRWWLYVGRVERLKRPGTYFTRELPGLASIVVVKDLDGVVRAFHNICAHRGNKVMWNDHPSLETHGQCRTMRCRYHGIEYGLDGQAVHITLEDQFLDVDPAVFKMPSVNCEVWGGFIFVNLAEDPKPLREFLGDRIGPIEDYPFDQLTEHYSFSTRVKGNWKLACDTICEWYHPAYVHQKFLDTDVSKAETLVPPPDSYHYELFHPHMLTSVPGPPPLKPRDPGHWGPAQRDQNWVYRVFRAGLFGPDDIPDLGPLPEFLNAGGIKSWSGDEFWLLPNLALQMWGRGYWTTYTYWPESVDSHIYNIDLYFPKPRNAAQRLAQELTVQLSIDIANQDVNTVEATQQALSTGALKEFYLNDQELLIRGLHYEIRNAVEEYRAERDETRVEVKR